MYDTAIMRPQSCIKKYQKSIKHYNISIFYLQDSFALFNWAKNLKRTFSMSDHLPLWNAASPDGSVVAFATQKTATPHKMRNCGLYLSFYDTNQRLLDNCCNSSWSYCSTTFTSFRKLNRNVFRWFYCIFLFTFSIFSLYFCDYKKF